MKSVMKRIFCATLALVMLFGVAGCNDDVEYLSQYSYYQFEDDGSDNKGGTTTTTTSKNETTSGDAIIGSGSAGKADIDSELAKELRGTTVKFLYWQEFTTEEKKVIEAFEKNTGIKIEHKAASNAGDPYTELVAASMAAKEGYDIVMFNNTSFPARPITMMQPLNSISNFKVSDWDKELLDAYKIKDKYYGVNINGSNFTEYVVMFFNETMFRNQRVKTPRELWQAGNWNWDTFLDTAKQMTVKNSDGSTTYGYVNLYSQSLTYWTLAGGTDFITYKDSKFTSNINNDKLANSLKFYLEIASKYGYQDKSYPGGIAEFRNGKAAMFSCIAYPMFKESNTRFNEMKDTIDAVPFPLPKGSEEKALVDASAFGVLQGAKNPEGALEFLKYFLNPSNYNKSSSFINDNLKDTYGKISKMKKSVSYTTGAVDYAALLKFNEVSTEIGRLGADQVNASIQKYRSSFDLSVDKANNKIKSMK